MTIGVGRLERALMYSAPSNRSEILESICCVKIGVASAVIEAETGSFITPQEECTSGHSMGYSADRLMLYVTVSNSLTSESVAVSVDRLDCVECCIRTTCLC